MNLSKGCRRDLYWADMIQVARICCIWFQWSAASVVATSHNSHCQERGSLDDHRDILRVLVIVHYFLPLPAKADRDDRQTWRVPSSHSLRDIHGPPVADWADANQRGTDRASSWAAAVLPEWAEYASIPENLHDDRRNGSAWYVRRVPAFDGLFAKR